MGERLRYADAIALYASFESDTSTFTGAKNLGFTYPIAWHEFWKMRVNPDIPVEVLPMQPHSDGVSDAQWQENGREISNEMIFRGE